jgi:hypothetical protein
MHPDDKAARTAGATYLLLAFTAPFSLIYVPNKLIVRGDAATTASNIRNSEMLFRSSIALNLITSVIFLFVVLALYRVFSRVDTKHAVVMAVLALTSVPISFLNEVNNIAALTLAQGTPFLSVFDRHQLDALAMLFLRLHGQGIIVNELFWGLWLFPFGILVIRSGFIPRILGILLLLNGATYVVLSLVAVLAPQYSGIAGRYAFIPETGELWIMLWLLIRGGRVRTPVAVTG